LEKKNIADNEIQCNFIIPGPYRPLTYNGLWEAVVMSAKRHLLQTSDNTLLNFYEMVTLLFKIKTIIPEISLILKFNTSAHY
jgi:hypothetical protein